MTKPCLMSAFPGKGKLDTVKPYAGRQYQNQSPPCGRKLCVRMGPQSAIHPHEKELEVKPGAGSHHTARGYAEGDTDLI